MGPGAPGFARVSSMNSTGKPALAHATRRYKREASLACTSHDDDAGKMPAVRRRSRVLYMRISSKSRAVVAVIALGACNAAATGEDVDPRRGQLIVFVQSGVSPLAEQFAGEQLPGIRKLAAEMNVPLRIVDAKNGVPEEITITPLIVYQNFRGRAIFQGRYTDLSRIKTFIRTSRAVVQGTETLNRTKIPILRIGRAVIAAPLKVAPVTGRRPDRYNEEKFIASAERQILKGFTDFRRAKSINLGRTDRRFYMDFYPWLSDDGTLFLTTSLYSQFHCKKPVFSTKGKPLTGPWAKRDRLFRQAAEMLERAVKEQLAGSSAGDGFDAVASSVPVVTWESLGLALPPPPAGHQARAGEVPTLPRLWILDSKGDRDVPLIQFRFPSPLDMYAGEVTRVSGKLEFAKGLSLTTARGSFEADPTSVTMGEPDLDDALRGSVFLNVEDFPVSRFVIESISADDEPIAFGTTTPATMVGTFELKGVRIPQSVPTMFEPVVDDQGNPQLLMNG